MSARFDNLQKIPEGPALRFLALANAKLTEPLDVPAATLVPGALAALEAKEAKVDMLRLLSAALPAREAIWWGCLAASDLVPEGAPVPKPLEAARAWVFEPTAEKREAARAAAQTAAADDDTTLAAQAVVLCDGKLGTKDVLAETDAPPGAVSMMVFGLNLQSLNRAAGQSFQAYADALIDRALDIARGGDGQKIVLPAPEPEPAPEEEAAP